MTQATVPQEQTIRMEAAGPGEAGEAAIETALAYCAKKMKLAGPRQALDYVQRDRTALGYFHYGLARQIGAYLAALDEEVRAVFLHDYEATPEDMVFGEVQSAWPLRLIIRTRRKTQALRTLTEALDAAIGHRYSEETGLPAALPVLDIHFVDDVEAQRGLGDAVLLHSLHFPPLPVWER